MSNKRSIHHFKVQRDKHFHARLLNFYKDLPYIVYLDSNDAVNKDRIALAAIGAREVLCCSTGTALEQLAHFYKEKQDWLFGYLGYDLKNEIEPLTSNNRDLLGFEDLQFFVPETVLEILEDSIIVNTYERERHVVQELLDGILKCKLPAQQKLKPQGQLSAIDDRNTYLKKANKFLNHIHRGDIYEANFCTQFYADGVRIDPIRAYTDLNARSKPPFAAYARFNQHFIISASPERYLKKTGSKLLSQPIKGTAARHKDILQDELLKETLVNNQKERSENVMIVDLVRNDLSRVATKGSVKVPELFGLYTFPQVHHMISSITAQLAPTYNEVDAIKATFPMGSMTGAPKISAMKIIEEQESFKRGVYSGAIGYFAPDGDFDFNVVIRTILYNAINNIVTVSVGSAITSAASPQKEFEECFIKARALMEVLSNQGIEPYQNHLE